MTKKDTARIARVFAYCEAHADSEEEAAIVAWVAEKIGDDIATDHPRFKTATFLHAALPIRARASRDAILHQLGMEGAPS